jgi:predicted ATP-grasp superfamily ATP-dependent carboligase
MCPSPERKPYAFIKHLLNEVRRNTYNLVIPASEFTTILMSIHKDEVERYTKVAVPHFEILEKTLDKSETIKLAQEAKIPVPPTVIPTDEEVQSIAREINYPAVIKPRMKSILTKQGFFTLKVTQENYVQEPKELVEKYEKLVSNHSILKEPNMLPLIQERIYGEGYGLEGLFKDGEPVVIFMHKRLREYPPTGGASTYRESIFRQDLRKYGERIPKALSWYGPAMVEFKLDKRDNTLKLMEMNGRLWGSLPLAIVAGVDFPYLLYKLYLDGESVSLNRNYKVGIRCHWTVPGELIWFLTQLKKLNMRQIVDFIRSYADLHDDVVSLQDPSPTVGAIYETLMLISDVLTGKRTIAGEVNL